VISKLLYDGNLDDLKENEAIQTILAQIDSEEREYYVGVDVPNAWHNDCSAVTKYKKNTDDTFVYCGTELL
jgi:hypothetical protein